MFISLAFPRPAAAVVEVVAGEAMARSIWRRRPGATNKFEKIDTRIPLLSSENGSHLYQRMENGAAREGCGRQGIAFASSHQGSL